MLTKRQHLLALPSTHGPHLSTQATSYTPTPYSLSTFPYPSYQVRYHSDEISQHKLLVCSKFEMPSRHHFPMTCTMYDVAKSKDPSQFSCSCCMNEKEKSPLSPLIIQSFSESSRVLRR